jgi:hypothetical protein
MPTGILRWEDPAPKKTASNEFEPIATQLRNNPGKWGVVVENPDTSEGRREASRVFSAIKHGYLGFRRSDDGTFQAATRTVANEDDGTKVILVHAQFVPRR